MAGSSVTPTRTDRDVNGVRKAEVLVSLACLSDDTNGLVPTQSLTGLGDYVLTEAQAIPDGTAPFTAAFEIVIQDSNSADIFRSGSIAVDSSKPIGGHTYLGFYPRMGDTATFKLVDPSDHSSNINVGNEKEATIILRFEKKVS